MTGHVARFPSCTLLALLAMTAPTPAGEPDPTSAYERRSIQGFTVLVNRRLLEHKKEAAEALAEVNAQLRKVARVVPSGPLARLREVRIWVERANRPDKAAEFHHSEGWLRENGYNPEKVDNVEIANARNFVKWSRDDQPWALFHELAHSYHFRVLGEDHAGIRSAYQRAKDRKLYESVAHVHGGRREAYAVTNEKEYFAEISEAYFGKNDFFPFTRAELKKHDPAGYQLMQEVWGPPRDGAAAPRKR